MKRLIILCLLAESAALACWHNLLFAAPLILAQLLTWQTPEGEV